MHSGEVAHLLRYPVIVPPFNIEVSTSNCSSSEEYWRRKYHYREELFVVPVISGRWGKAAEFFMNCSRREDIFRWMGY